MMNNVQEAAANFKAAKAAARARISARMEELVHAEITEEMARLSVEMHSAFNNGTTKEQLRKQSGLYSSPVFDTVWDAVPYTGRDVRPGRAGVTYVKTVAFEQGAYLMRLVKNVHSEIGRGVLVISVNEEPLPEPINLPLAELTKGDTVTYSALALPYSERDEEGDEPEYWTKLVYAPGEYKKFQNEVHAFVSHEINKEG